MQNIPVGSSTWSLDQCFSEIIKAEKYAHERKKNISEMKQKIREAQETLEKYAGENRELRKTYYTRVHDLTEAELSLSTLEKKRETLYEGKNKLLVELDTSQENLATLKSNLEKDKIRFYENVSRFTEEHGAFKLDQTDWQRSVEDKIKVLMQEKMSLEKM